MDLTLIFHIFSTIGFGLALLLAVLIQKNLLGHPSRIFLTLFLLIYFLVGGSNVLKQGGVTTYFGRFEYFAEIFFPPAFLFFIFPIFSLYMKQDLEKRFQNELIFILLLTHTPISYKNRRLLLCNLSYMRQA